MRTVYKRFVILLVVSFCTTLSAQEERPSCAVLTFRSGGGIPAGQSSVICNKFAVLLGRTGKYHVLSRYKMNQVLILNRFRLSAYPSDKDAAEATGRILGSDYVIYGSVQKVQDRYLLVTALLDVKTSQTVTIVRTYSKDLDNFSKYAPSSNVKKLVGIAERPGRTPLPIPVERPPAPVIIRPKPVTPTPRPVVKPPKPVAPPAPVIIRPKPSLLPPKPVIEPETVAVPVLAPKPSGRSDSWFTEHWDTTSDFLSDHNISIGTRFTHHMLIVGTDDDEYLGSIDELEEQPALLPTKIYVNWMFRPTYGIEVAWDRLDIETLTTEDGHTDGEMIFRGLIVTAFAQKPMLKHLGGRNRQVTPFAGFGFSYYLGNFEEEAWYYGGFNGATWQDAQAAYSAWKDSGSPGNPNGGYRRDMSVDNSLGLVLSGGVDIEMTEDWVLDLYARFTYMETTHTLDLRRYGSTFQSSDQTSDLSHFTLGLGAKYTF